METNVIEPKIFCPQCKTEIKLTESLAAPLIEATRRDYEQRIAAEEASIAQREDALKTAQAGLNSQVKERVAEERIKIAAEESAKAKAALDTELQSRQSEITNLQDLPKQRNEKVAELQKAQAELSRQRQALEDAKNELETTVKERVRAEREKIAKEAERKVRLSVQDDLDAKLKEMAELQETIAIQRTKLAEAQNAQAELLKKQRELEDAKAQMQLDIQRGIQEGLEASRAQARKEAEEALNHKLAESQQTIHGMKKQIEDLKRKAEQGSQQLQGEVQELQLESLLSSNFPLDTISPVPKGEFGGDVLHAVVGPLGQICGTILWECKRTKNWSDGWLPKLRDDQRSAKADIAVLVTQTLPKDIDTFHLIDGIWVTSSQCLFPVALCLRESLIELALARQNREGQETKMEMLYDYLTGPRFRQRVQAIAEAFTAMEQDLAKEKKAIMRQWAKREQQITRVVQATVGMYGDLQGIAGKTLQEIEGISLLSDDIAEQEGES